MDIQQTQRQLQEFAKERDWDQFHTPKNLAMALAGEAGELLELFQWLTPEQSADVMGSKDAEEVQEELADILLYVLRLADKLDIDLDEAVQAKLKLNAEKYPVNLAKGNAVKYSRREQ